jgi:DNA-binding winged helix-turn-helix (wHTH) protein
VNPNHFLKGKTLGFTLFTDEPFPIYLPMLPANPFYHRTPIQTPAHFFGRAEELRHLCNLIANGQSVALIGPRRIGKSSLLAQLLHPRVRADQGLAAHAQRFIYFDGAAWQDQPTTALYAGLWSAIYTATEEPSAPLAERSNLPDPLAPTLDFPTFRRALQQLRAVAPRLVLLLDEFDALSRNRHLDKTFFSGLRSLAATQEIVFVTASTQPLLELTYLQQSALSSPFFNIFLPQRLGLLTEDEAKMLLTGTAALGGLPLDPTVCADLTTLAGPHPFFLQIAGYHWWDHEHAGGGEAMTALRQAVMAEAFPHWHYQWRYLAVEEQRALALLATTHPQPATALQPLQQACLIRLMKERAVYLSPLFQRFVRQQAVHQLIQAEPLIIDQQNQRVWLATHQLNLAPQDYRLLETLALCAGHPMTGSDLARALWPEEQTAINQQARLKTAVNSLRRKLGEAARLILTDTAGGYRLLIESA